MYYVEEEVCMGTNEIHVFKSKQHFLNHLQKKFRGKEIQEDGEQEEFEVCGDSWYHIKPTIHK